MKTYTVYCDVHGEYEITPSSTNETQECPSFCPIRENGKVCGQSLARKWPVPTIHYKGSGWAGKES